MSFADYTSLKSALATDWLHRSDLTTAMGDFIALFESDFNATIRHRQMETETTITSTTGFIVHPANWLSWKQISGTHGGVKYDLQPVTDETADLRGQSDVTGDLATRYKVKGTKTYIYPATNAAFPTVYYQGVGLTSGTNWLLTAYPGAYVYGTLLQAMAATGNDPRVPLWSAAFEAVLSRIRGDSRKAENSGQVLQMSPDMGRRIP
ncbi:MAG TPA: hypothetical protein VIV09_18095 [Pseudolabrys sp.]